MGTCICCGTRPAGTPTSRVFCESCEREVEKAVKKNREHIRQINFDRKLASTR